MRRHASRGWVAGLLVVLGLGLLAASPALAQTSTYNWVNYDGSWIWDTGSGSPTDASNWWRSGKYPEDWIQTSGALALFSTSVTHSPTGGFPNPAYPFGNPATPQTITVTGGVIAYGMVFNNGVNVTLNPDPSGGSLTLTPTLATDGIVLNGSANVGINTNSLSQNGTVGWAWTTAPGAQLSVGAQTVNSGGYALTLANSGTTTVSSQINNTPTVSMATPGTLNFNGQLNGGNLILSAGTTTFGSASSVGALDLSSGSPLVSTNGGGVAIATQLKLPGSYNLNYSGAGALTASGANLADNTSTPRTFTVSGGMLQLVLAAAPPSVQNGSFESPVIGDYTYYSALTANQQAAFIWTSTGNGGTGGALVHNSGAWGYVTPYPDGNQAFSLQKDSILSQSINLLPGTYTLTWSEAERGGQVNPYYFTLNGAAQGALITPTTNAWTTVNATFTIPTAGSYAIGFSGTTTNADESVALDNVFFSAAPPRGINLPSSTIAAAANTSSTVDLGGAGGTLAGLSLAAGSSTALTLQNGTTLTLNGNASGNAISATGSGTAGLLPGTSPPALAIAANQNVSVASGVTLTVGAQVTNGAAATSVVKTNPGTLSLTNPANSYSGGTSVQGGTLLMGVVPGNVTGSGPVTVQPGGVLQAINTATVNSNLIVQGQLGGSGTLTVASPYSLLVATGGTLAPSLGAATGTTALSLSGAASLATNVVLGYNVAAPGTALNPGSGVGDLVQITGSGSSLNFAAGGAYTLNVNSLAGAGTGSYVLIQAVNGATLNDPLSAASWTINGSKSYSYTVVNPGDTALGGVAGEVILDVGPASLPSLWSGANTSAWSKLAGSGNWSSTSPNVDYADGNTVTFPDTANRFTVNVDAAGVKPASVTFTNSSSNPYNITGGPITGFTTTLSITNGGTVTLNQTNSYLGATNVTSGTLNIPSGASIASVAVTVGTSGVLNVTGSLSGNPALGNSGSVTFSSASQTLAALTGSGLVTLSNTQLSLPALALTGTVTGSGGLNYSIPSGTVNAPPAATLSYTGGTTIGGSGGTFQANSDGNFGGTGGILLNNATIEVTSSFGTARTITFGDPGATIQVDGSQTLTVNTPMQNTGGAAGVTFSGGGVVDLGNQTHNPGKVTIGASGATIQNGTLSAAGYVLNGPGTLTATLNGGGLVANSGLSTLSAVNGYTGGTTINSGATLQPVGSGTLGTGTVNLNGGILSLKPPSATGGQGLLATMYTPDNIQGPINSGGLPAMLAQLAADTKVATAYTSADPTTGGCLYWPNTYNNNGNTDGNNGAFAGLGFGSTTQACDNYDVLMTGVILLAKSGSYTFSTSSDDGSMLYIDGQTVVNNNYYQGVTTRSGGITLSAGPHAITIGYYQGGGGDAFWANYTPPGGSSVLIPNSILLGSAPTTSVLYGNPVTLTTNSTIDLPSWILSDMGALTLTSAGNTLNTTGQGAVSFPSTSLTGAASNYTFNAGGSSEIVVGAISDNGNATTINVSGSGTVTLNSATGSIVGGASGTKFQVNSGGSLLALGPGTLLGAPVVINGGTLMLGATSTTPVTYNVVSTDPVVLAGASNTILASAGGGVLLGAAVSGATAGVSVTVDGAATATVAGNQTLNLGGQNACTLIQGPSLGLAVQGNLAVTEGGVVLNGPNLSFSGAGNMTVASGGTGTISGNYNGSANVLSAAAGGTLVFGSSNSMTGTLNVANGAYIAGDKNAFGSTAVTLQFNGGAIGANTTLTGGNAIANPMTWGSNTSINIAVPSQGGTAAIEFNQPLSLPNSGTSYTFNDPNGYGTFSGVISGSGTLANNGYVTLSNSNTYTGGTYLNGGNLQVTNNQAMSTGQIVFNGGGFQSTVPLTGPLAVTNAWSSTGEWNAASFQGNNSIEMTQGTAINDNWLTINVNGQDNGFVNVNNGNVIATIDGVISDGSGRTGCSVIKNGGGIMTLANTGNTFSGGVQLPGGSGTINVPFSSVGPVGAVTSGPVGTGTIAIEYSQHDGTGDNGQYFGNYTGTAPVVLGNAMNIGGACMFDGGTQGITFAGPITLYNLPGWNAFANNPALVFTHGNVTFSGNIGQSGGNYELYLGSGSNWNTGGVFTVSGNNSFTGGVLISQGTLVVGSATALGPSSNAVTMNDANNNGIGTTQNPWNYKSNVGDTDQSSALLIGGPYTVPNAIHVTNQGNATYLGGNTANSSTFSGPITIDQNVSLVAAAGGTATFANAIGGAGGVVVGAAQGTGVTNYNGTVAFGAANSYGGGTTVAYGALALTGLGGLTGNVLVQPGATIGALTAGNTNTIGGTLTLSPSSTVAMVAGAAGSGVLQVGTLAGPSGPITVQLTALDTSLNAGTAYRFLSWSNSSGGPFASSFNLVPVANATWTGGGDNATWGSTPNWSGIQASGGAITETDTGGGAGYLAVTGVTSLNYATNGPSPQANVFIQPSGGATVGGPAVATTVGSLTLGAATGGSTTLTLGAGALSVTGAGTTVNPTGILNVGNGNLSTTALAVAGSAGVGSSGTLNATSVTLSGAGQFTHAGAGTIGSLSLPSGITGGATLGGTVVVSNASVAAGTATFNTSGLIGNLSLTGGTANFGAGAMAATADFSAGTGTASAASPLAITSLLKLPNGISAALTGGTSFTVAGTNLASAGAANTLGLSGGTLKLQSVNVTPVSTATFTSDATSGIGALGTANYTEALAIGQGGPLTINGVTFADANNTSGTGNLGSSWAFDHPIANGGPGGPSGNFASGFPLAQGSGTYNLLYHFYYQGNATPVTLTLTGLEPGETYDARIYYRAWGNVDDRSVNWTFSNGTSQQTLWVNEDANTGANYIDYQYTAGPTGTATLSETNSATMQGGGSWHWYGFTNQALGSAAFDLPNTNVAVTADSMLDLSATGSAATLNNLTLAANLTFTGSTAPGSQASFSSIYATANAVLANDTNDSTQLVIPPGGTVGAAGGQTLTIGVQIADPTSGGSSGLVAVGPGTVLLTNIANNYSGGTTVRGGTLSFVPGTLPLGGSVVSDPGANGTATIAWSGANGVNTFDLSSNGPLTLNSGNTIFNFAGALGYPVIFDGTVSGNGNMEISGGTLQFGSSSYGSTGTLAATGSVTIDAGAGLTFNRGDNYVVSNNIGGQGSLTQTGNGTLILTGSNTFTGGTTVGGSGPLQIGNGGSTGSLAGNIYLPYYFSSLGFNRTGTVTASGNISGAGGLTQEGSGTLVLSGTNTYSGGTSVENGLLVATNPKAISGGSLLDVSSSGSVVLGQQGSQYIEGLGQMAGAPLGSQAGGTSGGGVMAPAASGSAGGINSVPEPGTLALLAAAAACGMAAAWRRRKGLGIRD